MKGRVCELCGADASLYCSSDSAFLCFRCDADVHGANFLVARHIRHSVCSSCGSLAETRFSGSGVAHRTIVCKSCSGERPLPPADDSDCLSSESDCVSWTGSAAAAAPAKIRRPGCNRRRELERVSFSSSLTETSGKDDSARLPSGEVSSPAARIGRKSSLAVARIDARAEGILGIWRQRLGLSDGSVVDRASRALGLCGGEMTALPLRVLLAAAFWLGLRMSRARKDATWQVLIRRLEEVSGVPAKLIVAAAAKLARACRARRKLGGDDPEEGCAECSV
ncbi:B-box zinc finger protein 32 [Punica granatum]|uniref:B box-type domain-containing protein n=2 Tax=Punica granatum TaxID=22663 RepID=A0A218WA25_PUNGR|nr:B-box zinc finger protein 32 [Punica granatum]OWM69506.1 hypothetical protein CDL15_Pgr013967 [Punica granatum]PKI38170.1 hypothetical protein CRG98_041423 [Punica granatum]